PAKRAGKLVLGGRDLRGALRRHRGVARLDDIVERAALMRRIALHRLDQVRNQIVALLELHVDIGKGLVDALAQRDQPVVGAEGEDDEDDDDAENDPAGRHGHAPDGWEGRSKARQMRAATKWVSPWSVARLVVRFQHS